jgi:erythromycin esterase-like protein
LRSRFKERSNISAWIRERGVSFDPNDLDGLGFERLAILDPLIAGKRIAFVGEFDHFIHEKYAYRAMFLRYLASRGFRWIGEEMSGSDGTRINLFISSGDESWLARVSAYGFRGDVRADRFDLPKPGTILEPGFERGYPAAAFRAEQIRMARVMREIALDGGPVNYFGADVDYIPGGGYADLERILGPIRKSGFVERFFEILARVNGESIEEEIARLKRAIAMLDSIRGDVEGSGEGQNLIAARRSLDTMIRSFEYARLAYTARDWDTLRAGMAIREHAMAARVDDLISAGPRDARFVLMAHALHLAKNHEAVRYAQKGAGPGGDDAPALGTFLHRKFGDETFSVWMLSGRGSSAEPSPYYKREFMLVRGTLNESLANAGAAFAIPVAGCDDLAGTHRFAAAGVVLCELNLAEQADALCFVRDVTPIRE